MSPLPQYVFIANTGTLLCRPHAKIWLPPSPPPPPPRGGYGFFFFSVDQNKKIFFVWGTKVVFVLNNLKKKGPHFSPTPKRLHFKKRGFSLQNPRKKMGSPPPPPPPTLVVDCLDSVRVSKHKSLSFAKVNTWLSVLTFIRTEWLDDWGETQKRTLEEKA